MLFDEKDLSVFDNPDSRSYFKEILQSYYSQNYRATIVLLYSFVIYDLFMKLQTMANEGDSKANKKLTDISPCEEECCAYQKNRNPHCVVAFSVGVIALVLPERCSME